MSSSSKPVPGDLSPTLQRLFSHLCESVPETLQLASELSIGGDWRSTILDRLSREYGWRPEYIESMAFPYVAIYLQEIQLRERRDSHQPVADLSNTEQCIIQALREHGQRLTTGPLLSKALGRTTGDGKRALASLKRRGLLTNCQRSTPNGYGLPEWTSPR